MAAQQQSLESLLGISGQRKSLKQQLDAASIKTEAGRTTLADLPTVQIGCKKYIPEEYIANKNRKGRRSWIQAHGFFLTEVSPDLRTLQTYWVCSKCDERGKSSLFVATNTASPIEHLRRSHMITEADDNADEDSYSSRADIHLPSKRRCLESPTARSNVNKAKELTVGWIVTANLPFMAPSNPDLRRMLDLHDVLLAKEVPWSRQRRSQGLALALTYGLLQTGMLSLASTPTISTPPIKSNRDSLFCAVYGDLIPETTKQRQYMISWASMGYEIGLARVSAITPHPMIHAWRASIVNFILQWRKKILEIIEQDALGTFSTLQLEPFSEEKILTRLSEKPSPRRLSKLKSNDEDGYQLFEEEGAAIDLELMQNNETRWNSTFLMIQRAIRKREHIDHFIAYLETKTSEPRQRVPVQDQLSPQDWLLLAEIQSLLKPLHEITMRCQGWAKEGRHGALWEPLYPAAVILHPRWNVSWLEANWTSDEQLVWLRDAKNSVREFFEQHYSREEQPETSRTVTGKAVRQDEPSQFDQWMQSCDRCMMEEEDELGVYMRQGPVRRENLNPVLWWKDHQEEYPGLSKFALDILAIPAMSVDPERTFSVTKLTVSSQRHSISSEIIEEMQCLRNWLRHQAITMGEVVSFGGDLVGWEGGEA
ncbi:transposase [Fusarium mundagurra]|uniref:Transposase n=1 Tax=Fusarium mundagurra TaxID=1567541 RepID=A0A8H6D2D8_9HYPO|nr:transposase [Fusarium mundagurra]